MSLPSSISSSWLHLLLSVGIITAVCLCCMVTACSSTKAFVPRPLDEPNVPRGEYFSKKSYTPEALPTFAQVKDRLPHPIMDGKQEWISMYWKCWELAFAHLKSPEPGSPLVSNWLDEAFSPNIFQWDTIFMMMFARYGHHEFPAIQSLDNFYCMQHPSGFICREYREKDGADIHYGFDANENGSYFSPFGWKNAINPPLFSWAELESYKTTGDKQRFAMVLPVLEKYLEWLDRDGDPDATDWNAHGRRSAGTPHQLYWNTDLGSGMDNTPRPTTKGAGWVDMSCQMVMQYRDLAIISRELGDLEKSQRFTHAADDLSQRINRWCWNETDGIYYDVMADGTQHRKKTSGSFWPMIAGVASPEQAKRLITHLKDPKSFWRDQVFPTLAADEAEYDPKGGYWLGSIWAPTNYAIIKGIEACGDEAFATQATERYLDGMARVFTSTGTVWENYAPEGFAPGDISKKDFVGWSGIGPITLLIENVLGFRPDGAHQHLGWRLTHQQRHGIEHLRFGAIDTNVLYDGKGTIHIVSNLPYTLTLNGVDHAIAAGTSAIAAVPLTE